MRIAITRRDYITNLDGVNKFVFNLADGLNKLGHEVHVVSYASGSNSVSNIASYAKTFFDFEGKIQIHSLTPTSTCGLNSYIALFWLLYGSRLINKLDIDVCILNGIVPLNTKTVKIAVNHGIFTGSFPRANHVKQRVYLQIAKSLYLHGVDLTVCVSSKLQKELKKLLNIESTVIPLPLKLHLYKNEPFEKRHSLVLHIGTRHSKNVEISIQSVKILNEKCYPNVKLIVIGSRNAYVENLTSKYKDMMAHAKVLMLPSWYETFSYVVLEAFASGLPVVVSSAVPSELVKNEYNGFRLHSYEPGPYAEKIKTLLNDDNIWSSISKNALKTASEYSHIKVAWCYQHTIQSLLRR
ncbi:MAG: glycosyltransferase family 4 protein [Fervidobacterium sp.]